MFVDHIKIYAKAGDGGDGSAHFRREKYDPRGGPDGGDAGNGGSVILEVHHNTDNLRDFFYKSKLIAKTGENGKGQRKTGKNSPNVIAKVPPGTLVYQINESEESGQHEKGELLTDLTQNGQSYTLCQGGIGGKGNCHFKSPTNRAPEEFTEGTPGEAGWFYLELQQIADAGLVGFPNAGKSTLLSALSSAQPKIASYPFTTLEPKVGILEFPGFQRASIADLPGLIEGAHENIGLGHDFLRHIMRCRLLIFVVDMAGSEERDPISDIEILRKEIKLHDEKLAQHPWLIIANKMDLEGAEANLIQFQNRFPKIDILPISAMEGTGISELKEYLAKRIAHRPE